VGADWSASTSFTHSSAPSTSAGRTWRISSPEPTPLPSVCRGTKADNQDEDTAAEAAVKVDTMVMLS
jgi:hypothetical protein